VPELEQGAIAGNVPKGGAGLEQMERMSTVNIIITLHSSDPDSLPLTLTNLLGFPPRDGQIKAIQSLAIDQMNLMLIAPTGWGKSVVFQAVPALRRGVCLLIMPLNLLEEEQVSHKRGA